MYEKYAAEHPTSPTAPEALYNAAWRRAALIEIYKNQNKAKQIEESRAGVKATAQAIITKYPQTDWAYRARLGISSGPADPNLRKRHRLAKDWKRRKRSS